MRSRVLVLAALVAALSMGPLRAQAPVLEGAFAFNQTEFGCSTPNAPGTTYTTVLHSANSVAVHNSLAYDAGRGWGYEIIDPGNTGMNNAYQFGPFDESPNTRAQFAAGCPNDLYDSFIGAKTFATPCQDLLDPDATCEDLGIEPQGIVFRVDVPNGNYRFVAAVGSADNPHAHRILAEDGGSGRPTFSDQLNNHVVLVHNYDQSLADIDLNGAAAAPYPFARVGFGCFLPPTGSGPQFVNMDEDGFATDDPASSPTLTVTEGYIRFHQLQGNASNDANGGNFVLLEVWRVDGANGGTGETATVARSFAPDPHEPGELVTVTLSATVVPAATTIVETLPAGWTIQNNGGGAVSGQNITFNIAAPGDIVYTATAPDCGAGAFSASATPAGGCETFVTSTPACRPPTCDIDPVTGAVGQMLQIGPIDLGQNASANGGACSDTDLAGNNFGAKDYLAGGGVDETNVLVSEGDELLPDFDAGDPATGGVGVKLAGNPLVNPDGPSGILTVWRAAAVDANGLIDYNLPDNLDDPGGATVDDYIIFSLVYLNNTTGACLPVRLEVGSDDSVKVRVNGALVHVNAVCRGVPGYGAGDRIPVQLAPGVNIILIGVVERSGGTGVRLVIRDDGDLPLTDGSVVASCEPPNGYPAFPAVVRSITQDSQPGGGATVTLTTSNLTGTATVVETIPDGATIENAGGGTVNGQQITFNINANGDRTYELGYPGETCPFLAGTISGTATFSAGCGALTGDTSLSCVNPPCPIDDSVEATFERGFYFANADLSLLNPDFVINEVSGAEYEGVVQTDVLSVMYDEALGYGFMPFYDVNDPLLLDEMELRGIDIDPIIGNPAIHLNAPRGGYATYGPFDDSPNGRAKFPDTTQEQIYDSFIGGKDFLATCNQAINNPPDGDVPCTEGNLAPIPADGIIFRVDVPNGLYRFAAALGDTDNVHAHRLIAEDGGEGPPQDFDPETANHVVLISNFDQAQQTIGEADAAELGEGVFARVGFAGRIPPLGDGVAPSPQFVDMDADGLPTQDCADSPTLEVTQGYIRFHALQGNSNDGTVGTNAPRDPNGGDLVILEIWRVGDTGGDPTFRRGDVDAVGGILLTDGVFLLNFLFLGGPEPPCFDAADANDDGALNITTGVYLFNFLFLGGPPPPPPGTMSCGVDGTPNDPLDCASYDNC